MVAEGGTVTPMGREPSAEDAQRPPFRRVADQLRAEIQDNVLRVGQQLPTQDELKDRFQVSRSTIQRALQELHEDGFIDSQRGRAAEVADWQAARHVGYRTPEIAAVSLAEHLEQAFQDRRVTIDAYCLTTETLNGALERPLRQIYAGSLPPPESIRVRLLLPSPGAHLALPKRLDDLEDDRPLDRLRRLIRSNAFVLRSKLLQLTTPQLVEPPPEVSVEIRSVPLTPLQKLYILNGEHALFGLYRVVERQLPENPEWGSMYDVLGLGSKLFWHSSDPADPDDASAAFVRESREWFESLWSTIAQETKFSE